MRLVAQVHIAELYHQKKENKKFTKTIQELEPKIPALLQYNPPEAFKAMNYVAISLMSEGDYKAANRKFR